MDTYAGDLLGTHWLLYCVLLVFSGFVQGVTGFGFGMVALPLLACFIDIRGASSLIALIGLGLNCFLFAQLWRHFDKDRVLPLLVSAALASPFGILFLYGAPVSWIYLLLGAIMLASYAQQRFALGGNRPWHPVYLGVPCGLLGGWFGGAFGTGGPPLVAYLVTQKFPLGRYVASLQLTFAVASAARVISLGFGGFYTKPVLGAVAASLASSALGAFFGYRCAARLPSKTMGKIVLAFFGCAGLFYLFRGLR